MTAKPLAGLKVLELGTLIAGPFAARLLAEFGAEVIKIESPDGGDPLRKWRKLYEGTSLWWFVQARNKKSLTLNLKHPEGVAILKQLEWAARDGRSHLYLGYWIEGHGKMDYKRRFQPLEAFDGRGWRVL